METRFVADAMLGRLATWLRILGLDTAYRPRIDDDELIALAHREGRRILTRDTRLLRRRDAREIGFLVEGDHWRDQLRQVAAAFSLDPCAGPLFVRCVRCNTVLVPAGKESVRETVPPYVYRTQERFTRCPSCGRIYWSATHHAHMEADLREALRGKP